MRQTRARSGTTGHHRRDGRLVPVIVASALTFAGVALVVQQLDDDVLAPLVFGHMLSLHPLVVLLSLAAGAALLGAAGAILAVPVVALAVNLAAELRRTAQAGQPG